MSKLKLIPKAQEGISISEIYQGRPLKEIQVTAELTPRARKIQKYLPQLNAFQRAQLQKYYTKPDGTYTDRGIQYMEDVAIYNHTGKTQFRQDLDRMSNPIHEFLSSYRNFMNNHPTIEYFYDLSSAVLSSIPYTAPIGYGMAGLDAILAVQMTLCITD